jgi:uncharacterized protein (TIGR04141 family)
MADPPKRHLRLLRFRNGVTVDDAVRTERLREVEANAALGTDARIFIINPDTPPSPPAWLPFVQEASAEALPAMTSPLNGAIVFLVRHDRLWALTFGTAHLFVNEDAAEQRFGLRTVLNLVNAEQLRSVGSRVYEDVVVRTLRQVSRRSGRQAFTIDDTRDILRDVTGAPASPASWGSEVTGGTALSVSIPIDPPELLELLDRINAAHARETYKQNFGFVDHIAPIVDPMLVERLDADMMEALLGRKSSDIYLAPPEPLIYEDVGGFRFFRERADVTHDELDIRDYRAAVGDPDRLTLQDVRSNTVRLISASTDDARRSWSVYRCVVYETTLDGHTYLLAEGEWFEVDPTFVARIDTEIATIGTPTIVLPAARRGEEEPSYNARAATEAKLALLDDRPIKVGGDDMEVADLLSAAGEFIHVKRKTSARGLSHLFAQGRISATTLKADPASRAAAAALLGAAGRPEQSIVAEPYDTRSKTVVFAVIADNAADLPTKLPFFSRLNLWQARRFLTSQLDYQVAFIGVRIV